MAPPKTKNGLTEYSFDLSVSGENVPGVIWAPAGSVGERPLVLMCHGRAQHKKTAAIVRLATVLALEFGYATLSLDAPDHGDRISREEAARTAKIVSERVRSLERASEPTVEMVQSMAQRAQRAIPEWKAALDVALSQDFIRNTTRVGYWGLSMGTSIGIPFVAAEERVKCAIFGLSGLRPGAEALETGAHAISVPLRFAFQWDDAIAAREHGVALFDAFGSKEKTMHINRGGHTEVPQFEVDSWPSFFIRHLGKA